MGDPCGQIYVQRVAQIVLKLAPDPRDQADIAGLAMQDAKPGKNPKDAQGALCAQNRDLGLERLGVKSNTLGEFGADLRLDVRRDVAARVLDHRHQIIADEPATCILVIQQTNLLQPVPVWQPEQVFGMEIS